uniref:Semaphorin 4D n=1 Tax=Sus scrofa TaxID=9823 RepID=A0A8D1EVF5_PIG
MDLGAANLGSFSQHVTLYRHLGHHVCTLDSVQMAHSCLQGTFLSGACQDPRALGSGGWEFVPFRRLPIKSASAYLPVGLPGGGGSSAWGPGVGRRRPFLGWMGRGLLQDHCLGHLFRLRRPGWVLSSFPGPAVCLGCGTGTLPRPFWGCRGPWACPGITRVPFPAEPSFVFADVMRESPGGGGGGDDRVYFFFTEVSVEYEFVFKLLIPRVARVCKGDQGGLRTLQKKWTSFLKARLICSRPDSNLVFNVLRDVFVLRSPDLKEPVFYGVFTPQLNNVGLSAVCAYNLSTAEAVFSRGKYMQSATVEQSHTKWVRYNGAVPTPRPGACITREARAANFSSSLNLPDKTLQFVKDHPLMDDSVTPIDGRPRLIKSDVNYTQIVVDRTWALDGTVHDVMFVSTDRGALHKAISLDNSVHIIEETQLFQDFEPVQTLLLSSKEGRKFVYAGSNSGVVQAPLAFCGKHGTCQDCVLARDPYCAWSPTTAACITLHQTDRPSRGLIQEMNGDASACPASSSLPLPAPGSSSLSCLGPDSSSSPRSPWPALGPGPDSHRQVTLLPPFLGDQAQHVHALGTFHLFCQATGPADVHFLWEKNGRALEVCVPMQTHVLPDGRAHVLSWLRDAIRESAEYRCSALSSAGNRTSKVRVTVTRHEATHQEKWSRELAAWRNVVGEHDRMMQSWRKAWESCTQDTF